MVAAIIVFSVIFTDTIYQKTIQDFVDATVPLNILITFKNLLDKKIQINYK
jgi:hypothetical protein